MQELKQRPKETERRIPDKEALRLWGEGKTDREIAEALGVTRSGVGNWRVRNGLPCNEDRCGPKTLWDMELARRLYDEDATDSEIADAVGLSRQAVARWRKQNGLPSKHQPVGSARALSVDLDELRRLHAEGCSDAEIAERLGFGRAWIGELRMRLNLPANRRMPGESERQARYQKMMELYQQGLEDAEIARKVFVQTPSVFSWRKRNGLPANRRPGAKVKPKPQPDSASKAEFRFSMTDHEILRSWKRAINKSQQVEILAQLNACSEKKMRAKLEALGVDPDEE